MATTSVDNPPSIFFKNGQLKPGIYKIQNVYAQTYMDIHDHSKDVCCRPATALAEGRGLVSLFRQLVAGISDNQKWEIKPLGAGYSVRRVGVHISFAGFRTCGQVPDDPGIRLSQESLSSFAFRYTGWETNVVQALA